MGSAEFVSRFKGRISELNKANVSRIDEILSLPADVVLRQMAGKKTEIIVYALRTWSKLTHKKIAAHLNLSIVSVGQSLCRVRKKCAAHAEFARQIMEVDAEMSRIKN